VAASLPAAAVVVAPRNLYVQCWSLYDDDDDDDDTSARMYMRPDSGHSAAANVRSAGCTGNTEKPCSRQTN